MGLLGSRKVDLVAVFVQCLRLTAASVASKVVPDEDEGTAEKAVQHAGITFVKSIYRGGFAYSRATSTTPRPISIR